MHVDYAVEHLTVHRDVVIILRLNRFSLLSDEMY